MTQHAACRIDAIFLVTLFPAQKTYIYTYEGTAASVFMQGDQDGDGAERNDKPQEGNEGGGVEENDLP